MPHKHTRKGQQSENDFDLPPSSKAKPLSAFQKTARPTLKGRKRSEGTRPNAKPRKEKEYKADDTPRAFARLMQLQPGKRQRSGLDDGTRPGSKKRRKDSQDNETIPIREVQSDVAASLKIMPGERMSDFAARVNQALPMGGLARKGKTNIDGVKEKQTKTEKRLHKMYAEWRVEDAKRQEELDEFREQEEDRLDDQEASFDGQSIRLPTGRKAKRSRMVGESKEQDEDPWAVLKARRDRPKGLHDVVQAPPTIKTVPKEKFKIRNGAKVNVANVPNMAGSLKRREELGDARREVIERYRAMMKGGSK